MNVSQVGFGIKTTVGTNIVSQENFKEEKDYMSILREKKEEIYNKLKNGENEESFQIGSKSYTIKEWDKMMGKFDKAIDTIKEAQEERKEKQEEKAKEEAALERKECSVETAEGFI